jgi:cytochrome b
VSSRNKASTQLGSAAASVQIWDGPTRLVHCFLVALFAFSWWSARHQQLGYHRVSGYALLGVLLFRLYWGITGSPTARFSQFVRGPHTVWRYLRGTYMPSRPGHNPLGALSVIALLGLLLSQVLLGSFSVDVDGLESGPLARFVSFDIGRACAVAHGRVFNVLLALVALHICAVLYYQLVKGRNLIGPMLIATAQRTSIAWWRMAIGVMIAVGVVGYLVVQ